MSIEWLPSTPQSDPVFITAINTRSGTACFFGVRYSLSDAVVSGKALGDGYFVEYIVTERGSSSWTIHRLLQRGSATFAESYERDDAIPARMVDKPSAHSLGDVPYWKTAEAVWPTFGEVPMEFIGQVTLPDNDVTRARLTWDTTLFLFGADTTDGTVFKLVQQNLAAQTSEEHYRAE
jgi:hypothetical protein